MSRRRASIVFGLLYPVLSGCMSGVVPQTGRSLASNGTLGSGSGHSAAAGAPALPANYKTRASIYLVSAYLSDASGPPEISDPVSSVGAFGASTQVFVRYPVSAEVAARRNVFARFKGGTFYRCGSITAHTGVSTLGETMLTVSTVKLDQEECNPVPKFGRYHELEVLAAQCRDPAKACEVQVYPESNAPIAGTARTASVRGR